MGLNFAEILINTLSSNLQNITVARGYDINIAGVYDEWKVDLSGLLFPHVCFEIKPTVFSKRDPMNRPREAAMDVLVVVREKREDKTVSLEKEVLIKNIEKFFDTPADNGIRTVRSTDYNEYYLKHEYTEIYRYSVSQTDEMIEAGFLLKVYYSKS